MIFLAPGRKEFGNVRKELICYHARLPRSTLRGMRVQSFSMRGLFRSGGVRSHGVIVFLGY